MRQKHDECVVQTVPWSMTVTATWWTWVLQGARRCFLVSDCASYRAVSIQLAQETCIALVYSHAVTTRMRSFWFGLPPGYSYPKLRITSSILRCGGFISRCLSSGQTALHQDVSDLHAGVVKPGRSDRGGTLAAERALQQCQSY